MNKLRKMKTVIMLTTVLLTGALFISCNNDDDNNSTPQDTNTIIGKWQLEQQFENEVEITLSDDCEKNSTFEFKNNNTFIDNASFFESNQPCISSTDSGTWEFNGDNAIKAIYDGTDNEVIDITFSFLNGNLVFVTGEEDTKFIWKRIN